MSGLAGDAFVAIWHDVLPEGKPDYYEWHNREHMPERLGIPGFRRGRRYVTERGAPEYFNLYEVDTMEVLTGQDYLNHLNNPTPLTRRMIVHLHNHLRSLCRVAVSFGRAQGGLMMTWVSSLRRARRRSSSTTCDGTPSRASSSEPAYWARI